MTNGDTEVFFVGETLTTDGGNFWMANGDTEVVFVGETLGLSSIRKKSIFPPQVGARRYPLTSYKITFAILSVHPP
jgi:hypothetical protein